MINIKYETKCVLGRHLDDISEYSRTPVIMGNTRTGDGYNYSRTRNFNTEQLENHIALLYNQKNAVVAQTTVALYEIFFDILESRGIKEIIVPRFPYEEILIHTKRRKDFDKVHYIDFVDIHQLYDVLQQGKAYGIIFDTPVNPSLDDINLREVHDIVKTSCEDSIICVDNTLRTSYFCNPFEEGEADVVIESLTKASSGHGDCFGGAMIFNSSFSESDINDVRKNMYQRGVRISPFDAYLIQRGISTLAIRMDRMNQNRQILFDELSKRFKRVKTVDNSSMILLSVTNNPYFHREMLDKLKIITVGMSCGQDDTIATCLWDSEDHWEHLGEFRESIRISVGIEDPEDILEDILQAYRRTYRQYENKEELERLKIG